MDSMKDLRMQAEDLLKGKVTNKETLLKALPILVEFQERVKANARIAKTCAKIAVKLSDACANYALEHPTVFQGGLHIVDGVQVGDVKIDDAIYHLASGYGSPKRCDGENLEQDFLKTLPLKWVKAKMELDVTGINRAGVTLDDLELHGLYRPAKNEWSEKE